MVSVFGSFGAEEAWLVAAFVLPAACLLCAARPRVVPVGAGRRACPQVPLAVNCTASEREDRRFEDAVAREVAVRSAALDGARAEFERLVRVAGHDLRAPLRALMTIPDWIREALGAPIPPEVDADLDEIVTQAYRMDRLLVDLGTYARVCASEEPAASVEPDAAIRDSAQDLPASFGLEIAAGLPAVRCAPSDFRQAMQCLLSNAVKHHDRDAGTIRVSGWRSGDVAVLAVADDGPGIDQRHAERAFEAFATLKPKDEVEGSGLGLAIVRKIMERAGGGVRIGSGPDGRGAVLELTFAAAGAVAGEGGVADV